MFHEMNNKNKLNKIKILLKNVNWTLILSIFLPSIPKKRPITFFVTNVFYFKISQWNGSKLRRMEQDL